MDAAIVVINCPCSPKTDSSVLARPSSARGDRPAASIDDSWATSPGDCAILANSNTIHINLPEDPLRYRNRGRFSGVLGRISASERELRPITIEDDLASCRLDGKW